MSENNLKETGTILSKENAEDTLEDEYKSTMNKIATSISLLAIHLFLYLAVVGLLLLLWGISLLRSENTEFWPLHTIFGWGFAVALHLLTYVMYKDKIEYLTKVRKQSDFGVLFIYHALLFTMINGYLLILNLIYSPDLYWIIWPVALWGIGFGLHGLGFLMWDKKHEKILGDLSERYKGEEFRFDYTELKLKKMANSQLTNFWLLMAHVLYFVVVHLIIFTFADYTKYQEMDTTYAWGILLAIHLFGYILSYYINIKQIVKGIIFNGVVCATMIILGVLGYTRGTVQINWLLYLIVLCAIVLGVHLIVSKKWESVKAKSIVTITATNTTDGLDLDPSQISSRATYVLFWQWSFIAHALIYVAGMIFIYIELVYMVDGKLVVMLHPIMGWGIALAVHFAIFIAYKMQMIELIPITALIHLAVFSVTITYLILLNFLYAPRVYWSFIVLYTWGIVVCLHALLAFLTRRP